ncbi:hypothetical protein PoB_003931500 [Plakobranchus ocellatus]|uniref:ShKT domain-containing protein n=1 Tax=Plakobranchus ocellatus TaxID=259542 RepID=A0AAV4B149_9GAST|nr:hypothetical protein PoB_003931500 [Plakobranchus ocellatus]
MCYGYEHYCSEYEDKIQECLPDENPFKWCVRNHNKTDAWPSPQCQMACYSRFNDTNFFETNVQANDDENEEKGRMLRPAAERQVSREKQGEDEGKDGALPLIQEEPGENGDVYFTVQEPRNNIPLLSRMEFQQPS